MGCIANIKSCQLKDVVKSDLLISQKGSQYLVAFDVFKNNKEHKHDNLLLG